MTDDQMDARLHAAGEAWRAATAPAEDIAPTEPHTLTTPNVPRPRRHRTGLLASAAVVAAALVAGGSVLIANIGGGKHNNGADSAPLESTVWQFLGYGDHLDDHSYSTLRISPDGQLVADDECEVLSGRVDSAGNTLDISGISERFKGCTDTYQPAFSHGIDLLNSTPTYAITADGLTIGTGSNAMHFVPSAELSAPTLDVPTFTDTDWRLVSTTNAEGSSSTVVATVDQGLGFHVTDGRYVADEGCNKLSGELTDQGSQAHIATVSSTALPCPSPQPYEEVMQAVFQPGTVETRVSGAELTISRSGSGSLTYQWVPSDTDATDPSAFVLHDWTLVSIAGSPAIGKVGLYASKTELSVTFGCGAVGGEATVGNGTLHVTGIRDGAAPGCTGDVGDESTTVDSVLANDPLWRIADGELVIYDTSGAQGFSLVFKTPDQPAPADVPLVGTNWTLIKILDSQKHEFPDVGNGTFTIDQDGQITGTAGCNTLGGTAQVSGTTLDVGQIGGTQASCPGVQNMTETQIHAILLGQLDWSIDGDELALTKSGVGTLVYSASAPTTKSTDPSDLIGVVWNLKTIVTGTGSDAVTSSATPRSLVIDAGSSANLHDEICADPRNAIVSAGSLDIEPASCQILAPTSAAEMQRVLDVLGGKVSWVIDGDQLTITKDGVGALVFTNAPSGPTKDLTLVSTKWQLTGMETDTSSGGSASGSSDTGIVLAINTDGTYHLATRCHNYDGNAAVSGSAVAFSDQHDNGGLDCYDTLAHETAHLLDGSVDWSITGRELTLTKDGTTARFTG